ncbi:MAG: hypothetical protein RL670_798 [Actinomycetota bacterium]
MRLTSVKKKLIAASLATFTLASVLFAGSPAVSLPASCSGALVMDFPVAGQHPTTTLTQPNCTNPTFTSATFSWSAGGTSLSPSGFFAGSTVYSATIVLDLDLAQGSNCYPTYDISQMAPVYMTVGSLVATEAVSTTTTCTLHATFPATDSYVPAPLQLIQPALGLSPNFPSSNAYHLTTHWYDNATNAELLPGFEFVLSTVYRATVDFGPTTAATPPAKSLLDVFTGYTCKNLPAGWFTAAGAVSVVTSSTDYTHCRAEVIFGPTDYRKVTHNNIVVATPVEGNAVTSSAVDPLGNTAQSTQYSASAMWKLTSTGQAVTGKFLADTAYTVRVRIRPNDLLGFDPKCTNVDLNQFTINGFPAKNDAGSCEISVDLPMLLSLADLPEISVPVIGMTPTNSIAETAKYAATINWVGDFNGGVFAAGKTYTALITFVPKNGYSCVFAPTDYYQIAGSVSSKNAPGTCQITANFPETLKTIDISAIDGVAAPTYGARPSTVATETSEFTSEITWTPITSNGVFDAAVAYTANIKVVPKAGYSCLGATADFFKVAGAAKSSNAASSCLVTAIFAPVVIDTALKPADATFTVAPGVLAVSGADNTANVARSTSDGSLQINQSGWNVKLLFQDASGRSTPLAADLKTVAVYPNATVRVSATGLKPNAQVYIFGLAPSQILGSATTDYLGNFTTLVSIPSSLSTGTQALQINAYDINAKPVSISYGFSFVGKSKATVSFAAKSAKVTSSLKAAVSKIVAKLKGAATAKITLAYYANTDQGKARVKALAKYLKALGVQVAKQVKAEAASKSADQLLLKLSWTR